MTRRAVAPLAHPDQLFIGGAWVPSSGSAQISVVDAATEEPYYAVADATAEDMARAVAAARTAFDDGPWPRMTHGERAAVMRALATGLRERTQDLGELWARQTGLLYLMAGYAGIDIANTLEGYAALADTFPFEVPAMPSQGGGHGLLVREPVGVVAAIVAWNAPVTLIGNKLGPALLAGCTVVLKPSPEAPGEALVVAEVAEAVGVPAGVINVLTADRDVSELLVRNPDVDKVTFTGSTAAGRRIASLCGERIARCTLELGGKSAAVILDDADLDLAAKVISGGGRYLTGQVCSSLTRVVVTRDRHDEMVDALATRHSKVRVGDPFEEGIQMGPLAASRHRDRVEGYIAGAIDQGAQLATGGGRPSHLERGWFIEPTVFGRVDPKATIAQEEIFGPVISVIPADDEADAVRIANDTIFGLNASVFTPDLARANDVGRRLRSGTVGHNSFRTDFGLAFGGYKQSGIGREGLLEGVWPYVETKTLILEADPTA
jgi:acyl-CoA reductase-like NAD-dependent aldehyde dehydrogenase